MRCNNIISRSQYRAQAFAILWLGFYIVSGLYMGLFARWIGRYSWLVTAFVAIAVPAAIFASFEIGFKVLLPKSVFYDLGLLPF